MSSRHLRIKTESASKFQISVSRERLSTPTSADCSSQIGSFISNSGTFTHTSNTALYASSVSSLQSPGPLTPLYHDYGSGHLPIDMKSKSLNTDTDHLYADSMFSTPMHTPELSQDHNNFDVESPPEWPRIEYPSLLTDPMPYISYSNPYNLPTASTSFSLNKAITSQTGEILSTQDLMESISVTAENYLGSFTPTVSSSLTDNIYDHDVWQMPRNNVTASLMILSPALVEVKTHDSDCQLDGLLPQACSDLHQYADTASLPSLCDEIHHSSSADAKNPQDESRFQHETRARGKNVKKLRKAAVSTNRRSDSDPSRGTYNGRVVKIPMAQTLVSKRYSCNFLSSNGQPCDKKFQRVEHLKRHRQTHDGTRYYYCPDPECEKIDRAFKCRNDNLREHFKTHLRETTTKRNSSRSFEEFYAYIRGAFSTEDADIYISKLEKWRTEGGHLKTQTAADASNSSNS